MWDSTPNDWKWTFSVNVFGVAHGVQAFVPRMLASGEPGIVINTSSPDGPIAPMPQASVYAATKCAVTCLTECLAAQLAAAGRAGHRPRCSTRRARASSTRASGPPTATGPTELARERPRETPPMTVAELREKGMPIQPLDELADMVVDGIKADRFVMVLDVDRYAGTLRERADVIAKLENPTVVHQLGG